MSPLRRKAGKLGRKFTSSFGVKSFPNPEAWLVLTELVLTGLRVTPASLALRTQSWAGVRGSEALPQASAPLTRTPRSTDDLLGHRDMESFVKSTQQ